MVGQKWLSRDEEPPRRKENEGERTARNITPDWTKAPSAPRAHYRLQTFFSLFFSTADLALSPFYGSIKLISDSRRGRVCGRGQGREGKIRWGRYTIRNDDDEPAWILTYIYTYRFLDCIFSRVLL